LEVLSKITQVIKVLGVRQKEPLTMTTTDKCCSEDGDLT
jgi:hypothetical protein